MSLSRPLHEALHESIVRIFTETGGYGLLDLTGLNDAAAAYSLRKLRERYVGPAVRVRRSGDNSERDFSHGQLENGALESWVNQLSGFDPEVATDLTNEALAAHSLRDLTGLSRPVVRLRRAIDSAERDFTAGELTGGGEVGGEIITNGDFAGGSTDWNLSGGWSVSSGQASSDGSVLGQLRQFNVFSLTPDTYYKVTFEIVACSDYSGAYTQHDSNTVSTFANQGISSPGTYTQLVRTRGINTNVVFRADAGTTLTIDNVSVVQYEPSEAELWLGIISTARQTDSATVSKWYDQSASNEQSFLQSDITGTWYVTQGQVTQSDGLIRFDNVSDYSSVISSNAADDKIQPGTYRVEIDYSGCTSGGVFILLKDGSSPIPAGSGTHTDVITYDALSRVTIRTVGSYVGQSCDITAIRVIDLGNPATQTTLNNQPKLIKAGVTNTVDNKPAILFNDDESSVRTWLDLSYFPAGGSLDSYYVVKPDDSTYLFPAGSSYYGPVYEDAGSSYSYNYNNANFKFYVNGRDIATSDRRQYYEAISPNQHHLAVHQDHKGDGAATDFGIYVNSVNAYNFNGSAQEILVYDTSQLANRTKIERNINRHYNLWYERNTKLIGGVNSPTAAAAYSLRSLNEDANVNVVRLSRANGSEEKDFTAAELVGSVEGAELVTNGDFATDSDWIKGTGWTISGGQAVCDGSGSAGASYLKKEGILNPPLSNGDYYIIEIDIDSCSDFSSAGIAPNASFPSFSSCGITTAGVHRVLCKYDTGAADRFWIRCEDGTTLTINSISAKPYTPTAAELWASDGMVRVGLDSNTSATVAAWYDQTASNNQVFDDPTITGSWTDTGDAVTTSGVIEFTNVSVSSRTDSDGADIPAGTYRIEVDYEDVTQADRFAVGVVNETPLVISSTGSGTQSVVATFDVTRKVSVRASGAISGQSGKITGIRFIDLGNPATQTTLNAQPKLITAGVTETDNGKPAMVFDGVDDELVSPYSGDATATFAIVANRGSGNNRVFVHGGGVITRNGVYRTFPNGGVIINNSGTKLQNAVAGIAGEQSLFFVLNDGSGDGEVSENGGAVTSGALGTSPMTELNIGGAISGINGSNSYYQELILYPSDQSQNRESIEDNINDYYSIYVDEVYDGFVTVWYDQSKNSNHATQSTFTSQPKIVSAGVLLTENGKPTIVFDGVDDGLDISQVFDLGSVSALIVCTSRVISSGNGKALVLSPFGGRYFYLPYVNVNLFKYSYGTIDPITRSADFNQNLHTMIAGSTLGHGEAWFNGASQGTATLVSGNGGSTGIGHLSGTSLYQGNIQEVIIYPSDQSANRTTIETNINKHYNIY